MSMKALSATAVLLALLAVYAEAACDGLPEGPTSAIWPNCRGTAAGANCTGVCKRRFVNRGTITAYCNDTKWEAPTGSCKRGCPILPESTILPGVTWPSDCAGRVLTSKCVGKCPEGRYGSPTISCGGEGKYEPSTLIGGCRETPVCLGLPNKWPLNTKNFPVSCHDTPAGSSCTAPCVGGYGSMDVEPTVVCKQINETHAEWDVSNVRGKCEKVCGSVPDGLVSGAKWDCHQTPVGRTCTGSCRDGLLGTPSVTCYNDGWDFSSVKGSCIGNKIVRSQKGL